MELTHAAALVLGLMLLASVLNLADALHGSRLSSPCGGAAGRLLDALDTADRFLEDRQLLVYGDLRQRVLAQVLGTAIGCLFGLCIGAAIVTFLLR